jgi:radical SAM superfamily enzyme YgiQ (UPF0313 family)
VPRIVLTTLNARYAHASFGLRYLKANLGSLRDHACILEFDVTTRPVDVLEVILARNPAIVGIGVYIWNAEQSLRLVADLKRVRPEAIVVLGGPEVSHETDQQEICRLADYVITGEADLSFAELCHELLAESANRIECAPSDANVTPLAKPGAQLRISSPGDTKSGAAHPLLPMAPRTRIEATQLAKMISASPPPMERVVLPYDLYDGEDIAHRVIYVEASRGCPFKCEFCLSSLDVPVRNVPLEPFLKEMQKLLDRGVRQLKFVDRTFNLNLNIGRSILQFFHERYEPGMFLHFEMIPDRLPEALRDPIRRFPAGALQFEVGVQTFNEEVAARISRRQDNAKLADNLRFLREETGVHVHADLIVGLPGEDIASFAAGFDRLVALGPQEIQVGMLKRLRGTPIVRHDAEWGMVYSPYAPYEVLCTKHLDFATMQRLRRFSRYWDLVANSGNFLETTPMIWSQATQREGDAPSEPGAQASPHDPMCDVATLNSPFWNFLAFSDFLFARAGRQHGIALTRLAQLLFEYLTQERQMDHSIVANAVCRDYQRGNRAEIPDFLRRYVPAPDGKARSRMLSRSLPRRQSRHLPD